MSEKQFDAAEAVGKLIRNPQPSLRVKFEKHPHIATWIFFTVLSEDEYFAVVKKAMPYITDVCNDWLTNFGDWTTPKHFPKECSLEVSTIYNRDEVMSYLEREMTEATK